MLKNPLVSIVILNYNSVEETKQCINSLKKITYDNYNIIIVDNASKDNSYSILKELYNEEYIILESQQNLGYADGNNLGIKYAMDNGADYICVLNNDVAVEKDFLNLIVDEFKKDNCIGIVGPCICDYAERNIIQAMGANINLFTGLTQGRYKGRRYNEIEAKNSYVDYLGGACFVCKKEVFHKIGLIPENYFLFFEETEFCLSAMRAGYKLLCLYNSKIYHKRSSTISKYNGLSYYLLNRNRVVFIRRNGNAVQRIIFSIYIFIEALGRIIIRKEPFNLIENILEGFKADKNKFDLEAVKKLL